MTVFSPYVPPPKLPELHLPLACRRKSGREDGVGVGLNRRGARNIMQDGDVCAVILHHQ